jgi:hypothetical protein
MRWLAAYIVSVEFNQPICTAEPDVINYSLTPEFVETNYSPDKFNIADRDGCPTFTYTSPSLLELFVKMVTQHTIQDTDMFAGMPHISDQDFIWRYVSILPCYNSILEIIGSVFKTPNWEGMKLVHYGTPFFIEHNVNVRSKPKIESIIELRPL